MKHYSYLALIYFIVTLMPSSCSKVLDYVSSLSSSNIQIVKNYKPYKANGIDVTLEDMYAKVAGATGEVSWKSFKPKNFNNRPEIGMVQVDIKIGSPKRKTRSLLVQYLINDNTKSIDLYAVEINNKAVEKIRLDLELLGSQLPSFY